MANNTEFPSQVGWDDVDESTMFKGKELPEGTYCFVIEDAENKVSQEKGSLMCQYLYHPCKVKHDSSTKVTDYKVRDWLVYPIKNPNWPGHKAPNTGGFAAVKLHAIDPASVPARGRRVKGSQIPIIDGQPASKEAMDERELVVAKAAKKAMVRMQTEGPAYQVGATFFADYRPDDTGQLRLENYRPDLGPGEELTPIPE